MKVLENDTKALDMLSKDRINQNIFISIGEKEILIKVIITPNINLLLIIEK